MRTLALPLRIAPDGRLERADATDALLQIVQAMAASSSRSWAHAPWFGLQELFAEANLAVRDQHRLTEALNRALTELGIDWARVRSVTTAAEQTPGERRFDITLVAGGDRPVFGSVRA